MKCPICIRDQRSGTFQLPVEGIRMGLSFTPHYDLTGNLHHHDPNWHEREATCSDGHQLRVLERQGCAISGCQFQGNTEKWVYLEPGPEGGWREVPENLRKQAKG